MKRKETILKEFAARRVAGETRISRADLERLCRKAGCVYASEIRAYFEWLLATEQIVLDKKGAGVFEIR